MTPSFVIYRTKNIEYQINIKHQQSGLISTWLLVFCTIIECVFSKMVIYPPLLSQGALVLTRSDDGFWHGGMDHITDGSDYNRMCPPHVPPVWRDRQKAGSHPDLPPHYCVPGRIRTARHWWKEWDDPTYARKPDPSNPLPPQPKDIPTQYSDPVPDAE